ncbi:MAG: PhzF family phenazine biosynthesis protein [Candidatus Odinarchaeota archaeon]
MITLPYVQTSVFVDDRYAFGGNQLATFWEAKANAQISTEIMQGIALEMNFSETTFIEPSKLEDCTAKVRIFTPALEIPFAGHPTLGTAFVLKHKGLLSPSVTKANLELGIGVIPVEYTSPAVVRMNQPKPQYLDKFANRAAIAKTVGLPESVIATDYPMQYVTTGHPFLIVPITSLDAVQKAEPNASLIMQTLKDQLSAEITLLSTETVNTDSDVHVRMFAPGAGVLEDPATGSAAGPVGAYVEHHNLLRRDTKGQPIIIEQGYEMRRPSQLIAQVVWEKEPTNVLVSGKVKLIAEGNFYIEE